MGALYHCGEKVEDPVDRALQKIVEDDAYVAGKRTLLPVAATEGFEVYAFNCLVYREAGEPENSVILTLHTAPGPGKKPVFQIPFAVMRGENPPSLDLGEGEFRPPLPASARAPGRSPQRRPAKRTSRGKIILIILAAFLGLGLILNIFGASRSKDKKDKPEGEKGLIEKIKEKGGGKETGTGIASLSSGAGSLFTRVRLPDQATRRIPGIFTARDKRSCGSRESPFSTSAP